MSKKQTAQSFWDRVDKSSEGCWEWQGSKNSTGYGTVSWGGKLYTAHRVALYLMGTIQDMSAPKSHRDSLHVLHKCDNRKCCNPSHLFLGSYKDNQLDAYKKGRRSQPKGEHHANAKLKNTEAETIRGRYDKGETQMSLAKEFNVSQRAISLIVRGETYSDNT